MFLLILSFVSVSSVNAQLSLKHYELDYKDNSTAYMYAGIKANVRLNGIPADADQLQMIIINSPDAPKARLIGKRKIEILKGNSNAADFVIEMDDVKKRTPFTSSLELKIKCFSKINDRYETVDRISIFIRPIVCNGQEDEVCALIKTKCHSGNAKCIEREVYRNFKSKCAADSYGADILHSGSCSQ